MAAWGPAGARRVLGVVAVTLTCLTVPAAAQQPPGDGESEEAVDPADEEAYNAFVEGRAAFASGRYGEALSLFERSYELSGRAGLLYNIGLAADRLRRDRQALDSFERYLAAEPDTPHRVQVEARIRSLRSNLTREQEERRRMEEEQERALAEAARREEEARRQDEPLARKWWFWTVLGAAAVGLAVGLGVGLTRDRVQPPLPGTLGVVHEALRF